VDEPTESLESSRKPLIGREDDLDDANYQVREVYAQYGLANYASQVMEKGVVNVLVLKANAESATPTAQNFNLLFEKYARMTLGRLLTAFKKALPGEHEVYESLAVALPLRNFIAHTFFWDRVPDFHSFSGREAMLAELIEARVVFESTDALVNQLVRRVAASVGIDAEQFQRNLADATEELQRQIHHD
jgi:hypothetical protein